MRKFLLLLTTLFTFSAAFAQDPAVSITTVQANQSTVNKTNQYNTDVAGALVNSSDETQTWSTSGFSSNNNGWAFIAAGNKRIYTATITTDFAIAAAINKVEVAITRRNNGTGDEITSAKLLVSANSDMSQADEYEIACTAFNSLAKNAKTTFSASITTPKANQYYQLSFTFAKSKNNGYFQVDKIDYYGEVEAGTVAAPSITIGDNNMVSITAEDGAEIYYTTDGTTVPTTASSKYTAPFAITKVTTVKAIAVLNGKQSSVTTKELKPNTVGSIADFISAANTSDTKINTPLTAIYQCGRNLYLTDGTDFILAYNNNNNADVTALAAQNGDVISFISGTYKLQAGLPELLPSAVGTKSTGTAVEPEEFTIEEIPSDQLSKYVKITGVKIEAAASANNYTATDETGSIVLYNAFSNATNYPNAITLPDGTTGNTIPEGEGFTVYGFISVYTNAQGSTLQITPIKIEGGTVMETVATPVFTPASGSELNNGDLITISCATEGATIYVAFDDETPTASSMVYPGSLTFSENCKINAIAIKEGMLDSDVATATYTLKIAGQDKATFDFSKDGNVASLTASEISAVNDDKVTKNVLTDVVFQNGPIMLQIGKGEGTADPRWWSETADNNVRTYKNNEIIVNVCEDGYRIESIEFTQVSGSTSWATSWTITPTDGTWANKVWTAPAGSLTNLVTFVPAAASRIGAINVTYIEDENAVQGIEDIVTDNSNAPVEYYNLQGIRVNGNNLTPGIYVRRQGSEVVKILVK